MQNTMEKYVNTLELTEGELYKKLYLHIADKSYHSAEVFDRIWRLCGESENITDTGKLKDICETVKRLAFCQKASLILAHRKAEDIYIESAGD